jgi:hypothetical protein
MACNVVSATCMLWYKLCCCTELVTDMCFSYFLKIMLASEVVASFLALVDACFSGRGYEGTEDCVY